MGEKGGIITTDNVVPVTICLQQFNNLDVNMHTSPSCSISEPQPSQSLRTVIMMASTRTIPLYEYVCTQIHCIMSAVAIIADEMYKGEELNIYRR